MFFYLLYVLWFYLLGCWERREEHRNCCDDKRAWAAPTRGSWNWCHCCWNWSRKSGCRGCKEGPCNKGKLVLFYYHISTALSESINFLPLNITVSCNFSIHTEFNEDLISILFFSNDLFSFNYSGSADSHLSVQYVAFCYLQAVVHSQTLKK